MQYKSIKPMIKTSVQKRKNPKKFPNLWTLNKL